MITKQQLSHKSREFAAKRYGNNGGHITTQNEIAKVQACAVGYRAGWDACIEYLASIPWDMAMMEIVESHKANKD